MHQTYRGWRRYMLAGLLILPALIYVLYLPDAPAEPIGAPCHTLDGDTIRCGDERIRLLGIDAPELPGHCRAGRKCAPGDPVASTDHLRALVRMRPLTIRRTGQDRYGRTLAAVYAGSVNLSCRQIELGYAVYIRKWDNGGIVRKDCPAVR